MRSPDSIIFRGRVSAAFAAELVAVAERLGINPDWLQAIIVFETAGTFSPSVRNPYSGATGLIQFIDSTARGLGTTISELAAMTATEQLRFVEEYFWPHRTHIDSIEDAYMAVLWPAAVTAAPEVVIFSEADGLAYRWNAGLDANADGSVTKWEASAHVRSIYEEAIEGREEDLPKPIPNLSPLKPLPPTLLPFSEPTTTEAVPTKRKPLRKSTTAWGVAATALGTAGLMLGLGPETWAFLADGLQWGDLIPALAAVGAAVTAYDNITR